LTFSGSRDVVGHVAIRLAIDDWWFIRTKPLSLTVSKIFNGEYDTMVDMTLNDL